MKREKKRKQADAKRATVNEATTSATGIHPPKTLAERLGISPEVLLGEPKVTVTGDFLVEVVNHKGIVSFSEETIEVNTKKYVYKICGSSLMITNLTDDELSVSGNVKTIEKL